ncbi:hypothetical protein TRIUR3_31624 [Triticum urartu]|uniref:Uncharacterized protein n=1 Tax=Triticum urartu TaxID=4572 RepID=M7Z4S3_TRIUA|nr:hypothetical protein TRIUR3_31624 [Triticum urartu]
MAHRRWKGERYTSRVCKASQQQASKVTVLEEVNGREILKEPLHYLGVAMVRIHQPLRTPALNVKGQIYAPGARMSVGRQESPQASEQSIDEMNLQLLGGHEGSQERSTSAQQQQQPGEEGRSTPPAAVTRAN